MVSDEDPLEGGRLGFILEMPSVFKGLGGDALQPHTTVGVVGPLGRLVTRPQPVKISCTKLNACVWSRKLEPGPRAHVADSTEKFCLD